MSKNIPKLSVSRCPECGSIVDPWYDIWEFHVKFGLSYDGPPRELEQGLQKFRDKFITEEFLERVRAQGDKDPLDRDIGDFDACIDMIYVILGYCYLRGWDFPEGWRRVHAKNMEKERVAPDDPRARSEWDVCKPLNWRPPVLSDLVTIPGKIYPQ